MKNKLLFFTLLIVGLFFSGCSKSKIEPTPEGKYTLKYIVELTSDVKDCFEITKVQYTALDGSTTTELPPIEMDDNGVVERRVYSVPNGFYGKVRVEYGVFEDVVFPSSGVILINMYMVWGPKSETYSQYSASIPFTGDMLRQMIRDGQTYFEIDATLR